MMLAIGFLNFLQSLGFVYSPQSAQDVNLFSMQQLRTAHHVAFSFFKQPGHLPFVYFPQFAQ
jgi:hypothetical protein